MNKVLLISPEAFGYYKQIVKSLEDSGYSVDWLHQIPSENPFVKGFVRLLPAIGELYSDKYFKKHISWDTDYHIIIVIKGEGLSEPMLQKLRNRYVKTRFVFYNWDSFANSKSAIKKLKYFDTVKSFDNHDAENLENVTLQPLFHCIAQNPKVHIIKPDNQYCSFFAGTIHSGRFSKINKIANEISTLSAKQNYLFFYYPSLLIFLFNKLFSTEFRNIPKSSVSFKKKGTEELVSIMRNSEIVIDICNENQNGLTMRTIEAVGLRKKIVTNNRNIVKYPFYHPNNVLLINEMTGARLIEFVAAEYNEFSEKTYEDLHISQWLKLLIKND